MAKFYPSIDFIRDPTKGSNHFPEVFFEIIGVIENTLNDTYEVFLDSFINGFRQPITILKEGAGILFIDCMDEFIFSKNFEEENNREYIDPYKRFTELKFEFLSLLFPKSQFEKYNKSLYSTIIGWCVYKNAKQEKINSDVYSKYYTVSSIVNFNNQSLLYLIRQSHLDRASQFFNEDVYNNIRRYLKPTLHRLEEGKPFTPGSRQSGLIISEPIKRVIKGVAGSGKTTILAHRAVNAHIRTGSKVLILCYNITMRQYIKKKINDVSKNFYWDNFHISHYHDFFKNSSIQYKYVRPHIGDWENENYFDDCERIIPKYDVLLIDEIQDYKTAWIKILRKYFLTENAEIVFFGDKAQDIYHRNVMDSTTIIGRPISLSNSYRLSNKINRLCKDFHTEFLLKSDDVEFSIATESLYLDFKEFSEKVTYKYFSANSDMEELYNYINKYLIINQIPPDDVAVISPHIDLVRDLEYFFRKKGEKTTRMHESLEEYDQIFEKIKRENPNEEVGIISRKINSKLYPIRRDYKLHSFDLVTGYTKFSSLQSYKGWESGCLFFLFKDNEQILEEDLFNLGSTLNKFITDELIYTGLTRARYNLNIINMGVAKYHKFFTQFKFDN